MEGFQPLQKIVAGAMLDAPARVGFGRQLGQIAMEGEAEPNRRPIALDQDLQLIGHEGAVARLARFVDREIGRQQHVAHVFGPGLLVELDQALEFAQDMGVIDRTEPAIRQEVIVHDDAPLQILGDRAALFVGAIESEGQARRRMQPLQLAGDAKPRFVEMANLRLGYPLADERVDLPHLLRLFSDPGDDAGRTDQRRADEIAQRLRGPILGDELLDIEIDRRRLDALAILGGRDHAIGKRRLGRVAAIFAAVNRGLMFGDHERALGKIEHLALLDPRGRLRIERRTAMAARARLMPNHPIGTGDLPQRAALVAGLAAAGLARAAAQAARDARLLLQPVARRGLGAVRTVLPQLSAKVRHFSLKRRDPPLQRGDQLFDFGRENHPTLDSDPPPAVSKNPPTKPLSTPPVTFRTHSGLGVTTLRCLFVGARGFRAAERMIVDADRSVWRGSDPPRIRHRTQERSAGPDL